MPDYHRHAYRCSTEAGIHSPIQLTTIMILHPTPINGTSQSARETGSEASNYM